MVTLEKADKALKSYYRDAVADALNSKIGPFYSAIKQSTTDVWGKDVRKIVKTGYNASVTAGEETGDLPSAGEMDYLELVAPLKNLYGTIEISDKAVRAAAHNEEAFVNIINEEMKSLINSAEFNFGRMLYGNGTGYLARVLSKNTTGVQVDMVQNFVKGMHVAFLDRDNNLIAGFEDVVIRKVVPAANYVWFDRNIDAIDDYSTIYVKGGKQNLELTGLASLFDDNDLYGQPVGDNLYLKGVTHPVNGEITEDKMQKAIDDLQLYWGANTNMIVCSPGVRRAIVKMFRASGTNMQTVELEGGYQALSFNGVPIIADRFCPTGTMYMLDTTAFELHQLCDWEWLQGDDGKILQQVPGKPVYTATLVKYAELICSKPCAQVRFTDITEA